MRNSQALLKFESSESRGQLSELLPELRRVLKASGLFGLGEFYVDGGFESSALDDVISEVIDRPELVPGRFHPRVMLHASKDYLLNPQRGAGSYLVARRHYDLGNDLFEGMLDASMSYTCGYWRNARTLAQAQDSKLETLCRKLKLQSGMRVLDIGCGWGNFAKYAATHYGVSVVGVTVSTEQAELARHRCRGLPVEILLKDYREISGKFDRVVSIEMIEAVGKRNLKSFYEAATQALLPEGLFALQVISADTFSARSSPALDQFVLWIVRHIFPNGYLPKLRELASASEGRLVLEDMENLSTYYEQTLAAWRDNFERSWPRLEKKYGNRFRRIWLYYLSGCMAVFRKRLVQVYQIVYSKGGVSGGYF